MVQHTYDKASVEELLAWAKKTLESKNYPIGEFALDECSTILDCKQYIEAMIAVIAKNWENPTFYPTIEQLWEFREKIDDKNTI